MSTNTQNNIEAQEIDLSKISKNSSDHDFSTIFLCKFGSISPKILSDKP